MSHSREDDVGSNYAFSQIVIPGSAATRNSAVLRDAEKSRFLAALEIARLKEE